MELHGEVGWNRFTIQPMKKRTSKKLVKDQKERQWAFGREGRKKSPRLTDWQGGDQILDPDFFLDDDNFKIDPKKIPQIDS